MRRGERMITVKVRKGVYAITFHGRLFVVRKRSYWYVEEVRIRPSYVTASGHVDDFRYRYDSLRAFQHDLKRHYAEMALEAL